MLLIADKPTIQYSVEEAVVFGIKGVFIVTGKGKWTIEDHFDFAGKLERNLADKGKFDLLDKVRYTSNLANIYYIR